MLGNLFFVFPTNSYRNEEILKKNFFLGNILKVKAILRGLTEILSSPAIFIFQTQYLACIILNHRARAPRGFFSFFCFILEIFSFAYRHVKNGKKVNIQVIIIQKIWWISKKAHEGPCIYMGTCYTENFNSIREKLWKKIDL